MANNDAVRWGTIGAIAGGVLLGVAGGLWWAAKSRSAQAETTSPSNRLKDLVQLVQNSTIPQAQNAQASVKEGVRRVSVKTTDNVIGTVHQILQSARQAIDKADQALSNR